MKDLQADDGAGQVSEAEQDVRAAFVAHLEASAAQVPGDGAFHDPAVPAQTLGGLHATSGDARGDATVSEPPAAPGGVPCLVGVQLAWSLPWATRAPADRWDGLDQWLEGHVVGGVGGADPDGQGDTAGIDEQEVLAAGLAPIDRIATSQFPPCFARTLTASRLTRSRSTLPAARSSVSRT